MSRWAQRIIPRLPAKEPSFPAVAADTKFNAQMSLEDVLYEVASYMPHHDLVSLSRVARCCSRPAGSLLYRTLVLRVSAKAGPTKTLIAWLENHRTQCEHVKELVLIGRSITGHTRYDAKKLYDVVRHFPALRRLSFVFVRWTETHGLFASLPMIYLDELRFFYTSVAPDARESPLHAMDNLYHCKNVVFTGCSSLAAIVFPSQPFAAAPKIPNVVINVHPYTNPLAKPLPPTLSLPFANLARLEITFVNMSVMDGLITTLRGDAAASLSHLSLVFYRFQGVFTSFHCGDPVLTRRVRSHGRA